MPSKKGLNRPFDILKHKIRKEELPAERPRLEEKGEISFEEIMRGVKRLLDRDKIYWQIVCKSGRPKTEEEIDPREFWRIRVRDTSEYVEELVRGFQKELFEALHAGQISVSRVLNLHRFHVPEAEEALHSFLKECLLRGDRCVLIIHGRGLSSKNEPVLKRKVHEWLRRGPFRKYILGFCSARQCDGGMGATYVMLSSRPLKKRGAKTW
ncbi:MAG: hypothetical protein GXO20_04110 [Thermodesulfobacteria bacterium]|nr:hypothetical protein [Thermodesulfobacteriota bacterium]